MVYRQSLSFSFFKKKIKMEALIECLYAGDNNNAETGNLGYKEEGHHCQSP